VAKVEHIDAVVAAIRGDNVNTEIRVHITAFTVVGTITPLTSTVVLFVLTFPVSLLFFGKLSIHNNCGAIFYPTHCVFQDHRLVLRLVQFVNVDVFTT